MRGGSCSGASSFTWSRGIGELAVEASLLAASSASAPPWMIERTLRNRDEISTTELSASRPARAIPLASENVTSFMHLSKRAHQDNCNHVMFLDKFRHYNPAFPAT